MNDPLPATWLSELLEIDVNDPVVLREVLAAEQRHSASMARHAHEAYASLKTDRVRLAYATELIGRQHTEIEELRTANAYLKDRLAAQAKPLTQLMKDDDEEYSW